MEATAATAATWAGVKSGKADTIKGHSYGGELSLIHCVSVEPFLESWKAGCSVQIKVQHSGSKSEALWIAGAGLCEESLWIGSSLCCCKSAQKKYYSIIWKFYYQGDLSGSRPRTGAATRSKARCISMYMYALMNWTCWEPIECPPWKL